MCDPVHDVGPAKYHKPPQTTSNHPGCDGHDVRIDYGRVGIDMLTFRRIFKGMLWVVPGLLGPKPFQPGTPRPGRFGPFFNPGLLGPV